jgi:hypothetical protein
MRIGILTYHRSVNYGAVMQSAALAGELARRFPQASIEIVDYCSKRMDIYYKMFTVYRGMDSITQILPRIKMYRAFQRGVADLPLSSERLITDDCDRFFRWINGRYDIVIAGSDAVWNYSKRGLPNPYFLHDVSEDCHRVSFAASCNGLGIGDFTEIDGTSREFLRESFDRFDYIGVRDEQTKAFVHTVCPAAHISHNCDPSLLFYDLSGCDRTELVRKLEYNYNFDPNKPVIGLMLSNLNGDLSRNLVERIHEQYGTEYQTISLYSYNRYADIPYVADLTPQEWSTIFGLFSLTVSKYFHGAMFSLLNRTPVLAVSAEKTIAGFPNKVEDAFERLGISDWYMDSKTMDWPAFMNKMDGLLSNPQKEKMDTGIRRELQSVETFFERIQSIC